MHDTAELTGRLFLQGYGAVPGAVVVEIGAYDVNGSLRGHAAPDASYIGVDMEAGPGVDVVVAAGERLPFPDGYADAVLASSVFEHDAAFWLTFAEMCRVVKPGGAVYVSAPSNGDVHRHPLDCWRFYPDAGRALELASRRGAWPVTLVESFVAEQRADQWNDFVAVFRRDGGPGRTVPRLHAQIACRNVYDQGVPGIGQAEQHPEDRRRLLAAKAAASAAPEAATPAVPPDPAPDTDRLARLEAALAAVAQRMEYVANQVDRVALRLAAATLPPPDPSPAPGAGP